MSSFWNKLSMRERALVSGACVLFVLLLLILGIVRPLLNYQSSTSLAMSAAQAEYRTIAALAATYKKAQGDKNGAVPPQPNGQSPRVLISTSARDQGLIVSRIQPSEDGSLTLWMDSVVSASFYSWLKALDRENGLAPDVVSLQKNGDGTLRIQVQFPGVG